MLSADNAHAVVIQNHPAKTDVNCVYMNEGIVVNHAGQKYTSDAVSIATLWDYVKRLSSSTIFLLIAVILLVVYTLG